MGYKVRSENIKDIHIDSLVKGKWYDVKYPDIRKGILFCGYITDEDGFDINVMVFGSSWLNDNSNWEVNFEVSDNES